jgi:hypothetical protein
MNRASSTLLPGALAASLLASSFAIAAEAPPARKSGLWEIRTESASNGQKMPLPVTMQMCIDQTRDDMNGDPRASDDVRKRCSKLDTTRRGEQIIIDSVCTHDKHVATSHIVITGNLATDYRMENTTRFAPPMNGTQTMSSTMTGKWIGPCKPGQAHGTATMTGVPGMPGGEFRMDPEMLKRMQQMQQQYGR